MVKEAVVMRALLLVVLGLLLGACGGPSSGSPSAETDTDNSLNPAAMAVEYPPASGKLPVDLRPPV